MCEGFDVQAAGVAAAGLSHAFQPSPGALGLFFSASGAGLFLGALVGGRLADHIGHRAVLIASIAAFGLFSILTSYGWDIRSLTGARLLTGLGLGGAMPNLIALVDSLGGSGSRNRRIGLTYIGMPLGGAVASVLALVLPGEEWRLIFRVGGFAPLLILPFMLRWLPEDRRTGDGESGERPGIGQLLFGGGRAARTGVLWLGFFLAVLTLHLMINWLPLLLLGRGLSRTGASIAQLGFNAGGGGMALVVGALLDSRWRRICIAGTVASLPAVLLLLARSPVQPALLMLLSCLLGGAILGQQVIAFSVAGSYVPPEGRGTAVGSAVASGRLGSLAGPLFAASLLAGGRSSAQVLLALLPIALLCGACIGLLAWSRLQARAPRPA
ncbi:MAG TPA: MFS transporter [Myxococcaceae bacterium]|nr:MFS transporter [Myxococcaceae bacterium]